jgi:LacI family transcriptional regulator
MALETILGMSTGKEPPSHHIQLATRLMARESTAPPSATRNTAG